MTHITPACWQGTARLHTIHYFDVDSSGEEVRTFQRFEGVAPLSNPCWQQSRRFLHWQQPHEQASVRSKSMPLLPLPWPKCSLHRVLYVDTLEEQYSSNVSTYSTRRREHIGHGNGSRGIDLDLTLACSFSDAGEEAVSSHLSRIRPRGCSDYRGVVCGWISRRVTVAVSSDTTTKRWQPC